MKPFDHHPERYQPTGGIRGDGIQNQLGRPRLDRLTLLVREAVQNSWDAKARPAGGIHLSLALETLGEAERRALAKTVFADEAGDLGVARALAADGARVLSISDRGTVGLAGPTRADEAVADQPANFVNLLRHVGRPPKTYRNGGTYGFGKTALFLASRVRTILAYSQFRDGRRLQQRLIAAAVGSEYEQKSGRRTLKYTGRHWWGRRGDGGVVDPLEGADAVRAARLVGLPDFRAADTGTTIWVLLPELEGHEPEEAMSLLAEAVLRNFWPKMVDGPNGAPTIHFDLRLDGRRVPLPAPEEVPPAGTFVKAFANLQAHRAGEPLPHALGEIGDVMSMRPLKELGTLSLIKSAPMPRLPAVTPADDGPFSGPAHHVALLRGPHFVVRYLEGPPVPFDQAEYAGVFLASDDAEEAFARSEPPTHDDWSPDMLDDRLHRSAVRVAFRRIDELLEDFTGAAAFGRGAGDVPLGAFSDRLGMLLPGGPGTGARRQSEAPDRPRPERGGGGDGGRGGRQRPPAVQIHGTTVRPDERGAPLLVVSFELGGGALARPVWVSAQPAVLLEEGAVEHDPPQGAATPAVRRWRYAGGRVIGQSNTVQLPAGSGGVLEVEVDMPREAAIAVDLVTSFDAP